MLSCTNWGGRRQNANAAADLAKGTASLGIIGATGKVATAKAEALGTPGEGQAAWSRHGVTKGHDGIRAHTRREREHGSSTREDLADDAHGPDSPVRGHNRARA